MGTAVLEWEEIDLFHHAGMMWNGGLRTNTHHQELWLCHLFMIYSWLHVAEHMLYNIKIYFLIKATERHIVNTYYQLLYALYYQSINSAFRHPLLDRSQVAQ